MTHRSFSKRTVSTRGDEQETTDGISEPPRKRLRRGGGGGASVPPTPLPAKIIPFENHDKSFHERWYKDRDWLDIPHPFRMLLATKPNGGKTTVILNIILRVACGRTPFEKIVVIHCDPTSTKEYDDFDPQQKTLCFLEDLNYLGMGKE